MGNRCNRHFLDRWILLIEIQSRSGNRQSTIVFTSVGVNGFTEALDSRLCNAQPKKSLNFGMQNKTPWEGRFS